MRILVVRKEPPWPLHYGGRLHCYELCQRLARDHELQLIAQKHAETRDWSFAFDCQVAVRGRLYEDDCNLRAEGFKANRWDRYFGIDMQFVRDICKYVKEHKPDVVIGMNYQSLPYLARMHDTATICDLQDDEALHRWLELRNGRGKRRLEHFKCFMAAYAFQKKYIPKVDGVLLNSEIDQAYCEKHTGHPCVQSITHGVDCDYFKPANGAGDPNRIIFWGSLTFGPNINAIRYFGKEVWPEVRKIKTRIRWSIVGRGFSDEIKRVSRLRGVDFLGFLDDIRPQVAKASVVVVPMVTGAGVKNKILEAWAMGKAVLCTSQALGDLPGRHGRNVWIADTPEEIVEGLVELVDDPDLRVRMGAAARNTVIEHCTWDKAAEHVEQLCTTVVSKYRPVQYNVEIPAPAEKSSPSNAVCHED